MRPTIYPLPYPEVTPAEWPKREGPGTGILYVGANIKRKGGDVLLEMWRSERPAGTRLTFVSPHAPYECDDLPEVDFRRDVSANTPEHRGLFENNSIFLLPTRNDAYGFAVLEALNFGLVVVTTEAAGIAGLVRESGGFVGRTPEEAVSMAFHLAANSSTLDKKRFEIETFLRNYPRRLEADIQRVLLAKA
jgi:glycosyltransferase involved in cell wall biosynthesis